MVLSLVKRRWVFWVAMHACVYQSSCGHVPWCFCRVRVLAVSGLWLWDACVASTNPRCSRQPMGMNLATPGVGFRVAGGAVGLSAPVDAVLTTYNKKKHLSLIANSFVSRLAGCMTLCQNTTEPSTVTSSAHMLRNYKTKHQHLSALIPVHWPTESTRTTRLFNPQRDSCRHRFFGSFNINKEDTPSWLENVGNEMSSKFSEKPVKCASAYS